MLCWSGAAAMAVLIFALSSHPAPQTASAPPVWVSDLGDGRYRNPILYADYSDPDAIRMGDYYYMTSSSFSHFPGLPILHSKDLVNWTIIGHAAQSYPYPEYLQSQHGTAIWAPALRYHNGEFLIYFGDPDRGVFMTKTRNPAGPWEPLRLIRKVTGWIDPCPLWDDDGKAYLVHAWANSRVGVKSILAVNRMNTEGTEILDDGIVVFVGHFNHPTIEGPKFYKRKGYYYIFAPAGGVKPGWQTVLRSRKIFGPYEDRKVLEQGATNVNGPHQGAWVDTGRGEDWFLHFQDRYAYGRIVHLQPMRWQDDWPVIGVDQDKNGIGEPVQAFRKPDVGKTFPITGPQTSDEFAGPTAGLQWQWQANFNREWMSLEARRGWLRLFAQPRKGMNLWSTPSLMLQKFPAPAFQATARLDCSSLPLNATAGLLLFGSDTSHLDATRTESGYRITQQLCLNADKGTAEEAIESATVPGSELYLRVSVNPEDEKEVVPKVMCVFSYSTNGKLYLPLGKRFQAREGQWVGAKVGIFAISERPGYVDVDWFRVEPLP
jgi:beta-xylosidase